MVIRTNHIKTTMQQLCPLMRKRIEQHHGNLARKIRNILMHGKSTKSIVAARTQTQRVVLHQMNKFRSLFLLFTVAFCIGCRKENGVTSDSIQGRNGGKCLVLEEERGIITTASGEALDVKELGRILKEQGISEIKLMLGKASTVAGEKSVERIEAFCAKNNVPLRKECHVSFIR